MKKFILFFLFFSWLNSQTISVNNDFLNQNIRLSLLNGDIQTENSLTIKPSYYELINDNSYNKILFSSKNNKIEFKILPFDYLIEFNSRHPYNRNNGSMIPNRGYQHIISPGFFLKLGLLSIKLKPEHHYSENKKFNGFWDGHYDYHWAKRYRLWNHIDMPERYGLKNHNRLLVGQSSIFINYKNFS